MNPKHFSTGRKNKPLDGTTFSNQGYTRISPNIELKLTVVCSYGSPSWPFGSGSPDFPSQCKLLLLLNLSLLCHRILLAQSISIWPHPYNPSLLSYFFSPSLPQSQSLLKP